MPTPWDSLLTGVERLVKLHNDGGTRKSSQNPGRHGCSGLRTRLSVAESAPGASQEHVHGDVGPGCLSRAPPAALQSQGQAPRRPLLNCKIRA
jgi:hypothetical protein